MCVGWSALISGVHETDASSRSGRSEINVNVHNQRPTRDAKKPGSFTGPLHFDVKRPHGCSVSSNTIRLSDAP